MQRPIALSKQSMIGQHSMPCVVAACVVLWCMCMRLCAR
jgi:hypothetical protein